MYFLTELTPDDFQPVAPGHIAAGVAASGTRYKVSSICATKDRDSAQAWKQIEALKSNDQEPAFKSLLHFVQIARMGPPLTQHLDKKQVHEAHEFVSAVSGKTEKIWRYRRGDIRILFYYADGQVVLVTELVAKRSDKLEKAILNRAEQAVNEYLKAVQSKKIVAAT